MKTIGLGHYSRTGKDSLANAVIASLQEYDPKLRVGKVPFAWKLKNICYELYGWAGMKPPEWYETTEGEKDRNTVLPAIGKSPVSIWVDMGTPAVRDQVYENTWVDYLLKSDLGYDVLLIPDVRFSNEIEAVRSMGGTLIKVVRPGYGPRKSPADRALLGYRGWDYVVGASGEMTELRRWGSRLACWITGGQKPTQTPAEVAYAYSVEHVEPWARDHEVLPAGVTILNGRVCLEAA